MDGLLGYDEAKNAESWWDMAMPPYSVDSIHGTLLD
jgi:hypothetical protein